MKEEISLMLSQLWEYYRVDYSRYGTPKYLAARDKFDLAAAGWFVDNNIDPILYYGNTSLGLGEEYLRVSELVEKLKGAPREKVRVGKVYRGCLNTSSQGF